MYSGKPRSNKFKCVLFISVECNIHVTCGFCITFKGKVEYYTVTSHKKLYFFNVKSSAAIILGRLEQVSVWWCFLSFLITKTRTSFWRLPSAFPFPASGRQVQLIVTCTEPFRPPPVLFPLPWWFPLELPVVAILNLYPSPSYFRGIKVCSSLRLTSLPVPWVLSVSLEFCLYWLWVIMSVLWSQIAWVQTSLLSVSLWSWPSYLIFLCLNFPICRVQIIIVAVSELWFRSVWQ